MLGISTVSAFQLCHWFEVGTLYWAARYHYGPGIYISFDEHPIAFTQAAIVYLFSFPFGLLAAILWSAKASGKIDYGQNKL